MLSGSTNWRLAVLAADRPAGRDAGICQPATPVAARAQKNATARVWSDIPGLRQGRARAWSYLRVG